MGDPEHKAPDNNSQVYSDTKTSPLLPIKVMVRGEGGDGK